jgi:hypothetical protein
VWRGPLGTSDIVSPRLENKSCRAGSLEPDGQRAQGATCDVDESLACAGGVVTLARGLDGASADGLATSSRHWLPFYGEPLSLQGSDLWARNEETEKKE